MEKEAKITVFTNGAIIRLPNKRVEILDDDRDITIKTRYATTEAYKPGCIHKCLKGKIKESIIKYQKETFELIILAYYEYLKNKNKIKWRTKQ